MALKPGNHSDFGMLVLEEWDALIARYFEDSRSLARMGDYPLRRTGSLCATYPLMPET